MNEMINREIASKFGLMPRQVQNVLHLFSTYGMSIDSIYRNLGLPRSTIKKILDEHRSRKMGS